jgi:hypothetical protein
MAPPRARELPCSERLVVVEVAVDLLVLRSGRAAGFTYSVATLVATFMRTSSEPSFARDLLALTTLDSPATSRVVEALRIA